MEESIYEEEKGGSKPHKWGEEHPRKRNNRAKALR